MVALSSIVQQDNFIIANDKFLSLKRTILGATPEELDEHYDHAELALTFLLGFAVEKQQYRSHIVQVIKRVMEVPRWHAAFKGSGTLQRKARMLHPDLQLALGLQPEGKKKTRNAATGVLDREHCCTCSNCAKPWAFKCKYQTPHYCMQHFRQSQLASAVSQDALSGWPECAPGGFEGESISDTHVKLRSTLPPQTQRLVASSTSQSAFQKKLAQLNVNMATDKVDRSTVDRASQLLAEIKDALNKDETQKVDALSNQLGELIPQEHFGNIATEEDLLKQVEILELLDSLIESNELKSHDALSKYCDIGYLDADTEEGRLVRGMLMQNLGNDVDVTHMDAFRVSRHEEEDREEAWASIVPSNNRVLLWHGSQNTKFVSILRNGLNMKGTKAQWVKTPGGTFDHGIYFTDMVSKSLQYCGGKSNEALLVLAEVCLGSMYCCKGSFGLCFDWNARTNAEDRGCHSTWGVGRIWPDPETSIFGTPDSMVPCCDIPLGQPVRVKCSDGTHPVLDFNEFIVYNPKQVRLRYLVRLRYSAIGDSIPCSPPSTSRGSCASSINQQVSQTSKKEAPCILMRAIESSVLQEPYCRFARDCGASKLESTYRWQYYYDKKQTFDSTLPGWHSFGPQEALKLERCYSSGERSVKIRSSNGYEYDMDFTAMVQVNCSTNKTRSIRRKEVAFKRHAVPGGKAMQINADLGEGEIVDWTFEVENEMRLDFTAKFTGATSQAEAQEIVRATLGANCWSFTAPEAGSLMLRWKNTFPFSYDRSVLLDWHREAAPVQPGRQFGAAPQRLESQAGYGAEDTTVMRSLSTWLAEASPLGGAEEDPESIKAQALEESRQVIRSHLAQHLANNPDASYVSWIAALHPENVKLDPRLCGDQGNEWLNVWKELSQPAAASTVQNQ
jgi:hypothetical protein